MALIYGLHPDLCSALTLYPTWTWLVPGLLLVGLGWSRFTKPFVLVAAILWLLYSVVFVEEFKSLVRFRQLSASDWGAAHQRGKALRIVSLNCAGGNKNAAMEALPYQPDIVLFQESPNRQAVDELTRLFFNDGGESYWKGETSLIVRGHVQPTVLSHPSHFFMEARVRLKSGIEMEVINLRNITYPVRADFWSSRCWREQKATRQTQFAQMRDVVRQTESLSDAIPLIIGGDFNAPSGDPVFHLLQPRLHDTFKEGGSGWGDTILNDMPVLRIDQVWASSHFRASAVVAHRTQNSDHRMVICDLLFCASKSDSLP